MLLDTVRNESCLDTLKNLPDNSIDSIVTDPPYHLTSITKRFGKKGSTEPTLKNNDGSFSRLAKGFMGKEWDGVDENGMGIAFNPELWAECLRVLKPGGHMVAFSGTRTYHRMACAIEDAGFEIRDQLQWVYNTGFPKSMSIDKAIDKKFGKEREVIGSYKIGGMSPDRENFGANDRNGGQGMGFRPGDIKMTAPATDEAKYWNGWGTALKPSFEPIVLCRKPLSEKTVADNVLKWGTGAINIDATRIGDETIKTNAKEKGVSFTHLTGFIGCEESYHQGRFPANTITTEENSEIIESRFFNIVPKELQKKASKKDRNSKWNGEEMVGEGKVANPNFGSGGFSRPKEDEEHRKPKPSKNYHPTVKPTALMEWLIKLITPYNGVVYEPFAGSGSTLVAAKRLQQTNPLYSNLHFLGSELEAEYVEIIKSRLA